MDFKNDMTPMHQDGDGLRGKMYANGIRSVFAFITFPVGHQTPSICQASPPFLASAAILCYHYRFETCIFIFPVNDAIFFLFSHVIRTKSILRTQTVSAYN